MWCDRMTGLILLGRASSAYSLARTLTLRWSMPSWQMSACVSEGGGRGEGEVSWQDSGLTWPRTTGRRASPLEEDRYHRPRQECPAP